MSNTWRIGASTIRKYADIICDILTDGNQLFSHYISISNENRLLHIILDFRETTSLPHICGAIDGLHIPLSKSPNRRVTLVASNVYNRKKFNSIILQVVCDSRKIFWNVCIGQPRGMHDGEQFKVSSLYKSLKRHDILQEPRLLVGDVECTLYLIGDSAYPIRTYLHKN